MQLSLALKSTLASALIWAAATLPAAAFELVMVEEHGCVWCARWDAEIAPIYPKTPEGADAPLRRININDTLPDDIAVTRRLVYTPTFVLLENGREVSRIEGYPGPDFFWGILAQMIDEAKTNEEGS